LPVAEPALNCATYDPADEPLFSTNNGAVEVYNDDPAETLSGPFGVDVPIPT
jgi:hypothetical protein